MSTKKGEHELDEDTVSILLTRRGTSLKLAKNRPKNGGNYQKFLEEVFQVCMLVKKPASEIRLSAIKT